MNEGFPEKASSVGIDQQSARIQVEKLIRADSKDEFVSFLRGHQVNSGMNSCIFSPTELIKFVCLHRAVGCATALLEGSTSLNVNLVALLDAGVSPLHLAAESLSYDLTKLFLQHEDQTDFYYSYGSKDPPILPVSAALEAICHHEYVSDWSPKKSAFKLFYIFCLPELKEPLETIKLLASRTPQSKLEAISLCCVKEGKIVQLAALLLVAWNSLVASHLESDNTITPIQQSIFGELKCLQHEIDAIMAKYPLGNKLSRAYERKKANVESVSKMFDILWSAHNVIETYRLSSRPKRVPKHEVPYELGLRLFFEGDLQLNRKDVYSKDIKCLRRRLELNDRGSSCANGSSTSEDEAFLKKNVHSGFLGTIGRKPPIHLPSRSFHTCQLVARPSVPEIPAFAKICGRLFMTAKSSLRRL